MQQKIIFALLSIVYSSTYTMEQNVQPNLATNIEMNPETGLPKDCFLVIKFKDGDAIYLKKDPYWNDFMLGNIFVDSTTKRLYLDLSRKGKESNKYFSVLAGGRETRESAKWYDNTSNGKQERQFYLTDFEGDTVSLNQNAILYVSTTKTFEWLFKN